MKIRLITKTMSITVVCVTVLMLLATPVFYELTEEYYTDQIEDVIKDIKKGKPLPKDIDLKHEILEGVATQFGIVMVIFAIGVILSTLLVSKRLWRPFENTLREIKQFRLEEQHLPTFPQTDIKEFTQLNTSVSELMAKSINSYSQQKEFTENASHELQTPLAILRSKLDLLIQQPDLTEQQAKTVEELYDVTSRMSRLSRDLLLLSKIENSQYEKAEPISLSDTITRILNNIEPLFGDMSHNIDISSDSAIVNANPVLFEVVMNNLVVNAIRHNSQTGIIDVTLRGDTFSVSNTANADKLDKERIFSRFYKPDGERSVGNGLGLAIVKSICDHYGWTINYEFHKGRHVFSIKFSPKG